MLNDILTPMNHREIEYNAKKLSGWEIPDSFACAAVQGENASTDLAQQDKYQMLFNRNILLKWLDETGARVFDDDLVMDYGTDCLRLYLLFEQTPKENDAPYYNSWQEGALEGIYKFLGRTRRVMLAADMWNRSGHYNEEMFPAASVHRLGTALETTDAKIRKCICRGNTMSNRHHIVAALMELLNVYQRELKTGDIMAFIHTQAVERAVPHGSTEAEGEIRQKADPRFNPDIADCCRKFVILMAPYAPDLCKMLWVELRNG
ncbi:MAG: hypothetical protein K2L86_04490 [Lachnospiraceae bacterium]|nr:hypothetical protein [Lachnospiraceae bacterium]